MAKEEFPKKTNNDSTSTKYFDISTDPHDLKVDTFKPSPPAEQFNISEDPEGLELEQDFSVDAEYTPITEDPTNLKVDTFKPSPPAEQFDISEDPEGLDATPPQEQKSFDKDNKESQKLSNEDNDESLLGSCLRFLGNVFGVTREKPTIERDAPDLEDSIATFESILKKESVKSSVNEYELVEKAFRGFNDNGTILYSTVTVYKDPDSKNLFFLCRELNSARTHLWNKDGNLQPDTNAAADMMKRTEYLLSNGKIVAKGSSKNL